MNEAALALMMKEQDRIVDVKEGAFSDVCFGHRFESRRG